VSVLQFTMYGMVRKMNKTGYWVGIGFMLFISGLLIWGMA